MKIERDKPFVSRMIAELLSHNVQHGKECRSRPVELYNKDLERLIVLACDGQLYRENRRKSKQSTRRKSRQES